MKKNGFTLIEILAVIAILGIIIAIAIPSVISIGNKNKKNLYCSKIEILEKNGIRWGNDNRDLLQVLSGSENHNDVILPTSKILVQDLIDEYIKVDDIKTGSIIDPRNNDSMNERDIIVYLKNNRVYAKFIPIPQDVDVCN